MHDRNNDDKYDSHEESEYHFSDDDVSYESDHHEDAHASGSATPRSYTSMFTRKRMIVAGVVVGLVIVVYQFIAPTTTVPSTDIAAGQPVVAQQEGPMRANVPSAAQPVLETAETASQPPQAAAPAQATPPVTVSSPVAATTPPSASTVATTVTAAPTQPASSLLAPTAPADLQSAPMITMPDIIPMQSTTPAAQTINQAVAVPKSAPETDAKVAALQAQSTQLMAQLQENYNQKLNDYAAQNKALQAQIQLLDTRVAGLEADIKQMLQAVTQQSQQQRSTGTLPSSQATPEASDSSIVGAPSSAQASAGSIAGYSVQAIIPGRAWLRAQNGETVTVAEGDSVRDLGRITKIDPYDGVVEINTGNKVVSLSYGSVGS